MAQRSLRILILSSSFSLSPSEVGGQRNGERKKEKEK